MQKGIIACGGMVVGLVLLVMALFGPWYTISGSGSGVLGTDYTVNMYLTQMEAQGTVMGQTISYSVRYADAAENAQNQGINTESFAVINNAMYLTVAACIMAVVSIIAIVVFLLEKGKRNMLRYLGGSTGMLTCILSIVPAVYFMMTGFTSANTGFWYSQEAMGFTSSGGPGYAWYLMIAVAVITGVSAVTVLLRKNATPVQSVQDAAPPLQ